MTYSSLVPNFTPTSTGATAADLFNQPLAGVRAALDAAEAADTALDTRVDALEAGGILVANTLASNSSGITTGTWTATLGSAALPSRVRVTMSGRCSSTVAGDQIAVGLFVDSTQVATAVVTVPAAGGAGQVTVTVVNVVTIPAGTHTLSLSGTRPVGTGTGTVLAGWFTLVEAAA
ncbi:MAG: hypothetical protein FWF90_15620 [Promicromonosporaceae bacterium]|nr:hypothetical protein [Promicromonosporaceae bacterium]